MENLNSQGKDLVTINYKETTITLKSGDKVTLSVTDKKLTEDVVITSVLPEEAIVWDGSYTISDSVSLINFTIDGISYEAEEGMTWYEWANSDYNTANNAYSKAWLCTDNNMPVELNYGGNTLSVTLDGSSSNKVHGSDIITDGHAYGIYVASGGGAN